jgi:hypothetical protein
VRYNHKGASQEEIVPEAANTICTYFWSSGCITEKARPLQIGEDYVIDNVAHRCFRRDSSVYYRQFICGVFGQPPCDKVQIIISNCNCFENFFIDFQLDSVTNETTTIKTNSGNLGGLPAIAGLPDGWKIVDAQGNPVHVSNIHVVSSSIGTPMAGANRNQRKRRHVRFLRAATTTERTTVDGLFNCILRKESKDYDTISVRHPTA